MAAGKCRARRGTRSRPTGATLRAWRACGVDYLAGVQMLVARRAALIATLEQVIPDTRHAITIARLRCFRGIDTLSAAGLCAEVGD